MRLHVSCKGVINQACVCCEFESLSAVAWGDCSPYSRDRWAVLPGLSSPLAAHESWLIFIKALLNFLSWGCCWWDTLSHCSATGAGLATADIFSTCFSPFKFHSHNSSFVLSLRASNVIQNWSYSSLLLAKCPLSLQGLLHHSLCGSIATSDERDSGESVMVSAAVLGPIGAGCMKGSAVTVRMWKMEAVCIFAWAQVVRQW